jgi:hypothetical protein
LILTLCAIAVAAVLSAECAGGQPAQARVLPAPGDSTRLESPVADAGGRDAPARDELSAAADDSVQADRYGPPASPPSGGDVRTLLGEARPRLAEDVPGGRSAGTGWDGHRIACSDGFLSPALTGLMLRGRPADDWLGRGLDLLGATMPDEHPTAPVGHDLSLWPVYTSEDPAFRRGPAAPWAPGLSVDLRPGRRPHDRPFSRVTQIAGDLGRRALAAEFGRFYGDATFATSGFMENDEGRAPGGGGSCGTEMLGGSLAVPLSSEWLAEVGGMRTELRRSDPSWGIRGTGVRREQVLSDVHARVEGSGSTLEVYYTQSWIESESAGGSVNSECEGLFIEAGGPWRLDRIAVQIERRRAGGPLLDGDHEALGAGVRAGGSTSVRGAEVALAGGLSLLDRDVSPSVSVAANGDGSVGSWTVDAAYWERYPSAQERFVRAVPAETHDGSDLSVRGSDLLEPEGAATLGASYAWPGLLAGVGIEGRMALAVDPITLGVPCSGVATPANAHEELGGRAVVWAALGDTSGARGGADITVLAVDPEGAMNALAPLPAVRVRAEITVPLHFFESFLRTSWRAALEHESGLERGPWRGLIDDARTSLGVSVSGTAGAARVFVSVRNVLGTDGARMPGADPGERIFTAGYSWTFLD